MDGRGEEEWRGSEGGKEGEEGDEEGGNLAVSAKQKGKEVEGEVGIFREEAGENEEKGSFSTGKLEKSNCGLLFRPELLLRMSLLASIRGIFLVAASSLICL